MNSKIKKNLVIGTIVILLVVNISALATIIYTNKVRAEKLEEMKQMETEMRERGMQEFFREELKLTDEQAVKFNNSHTKYFEQTHVIAYELRDRRHEMMIEIAKINPNSDKLDAIAKDIGMLHYDLKKVTINHFIELKEICNKDQQKILYKMFFRMINEQDGNKPERGPRGRGRPNHRNRNNN